MELSDCPVFIVGSPRSGTSLMCRMIDGHPNIFVPQWETGLFVRFDEILNGQLEWVLKKAKDAFPFERTDIVGWMRESTESLFTRFAEKCGKWRWAEKTPSHIFHIELMHEMFPKARFIHMIRDGRDVIRSLQQMPWATRKVRWNIKQWVDSVQIGRKAGQKLPTGCYTEVYYEKLIEDPKRTLERLCDFLAEPYSPRMLEFHLPENNSWGVAQRPVQNKPVNLRPSLSFAQRILVKFMAGPLLRELGYA
jgi:hypothetical protein